MAFRQETYLCQPKTIEDYEKHNLKAKNIFLEDTIGPQRRRVVLGLDDEYLMKVKVCFCEGIKYCNMFFLLVTNY